MVNVYKKHILINLHKILLFYSLNYRKSLFAKW